jgi:hypothetical protein
MRQRRASTTTYNQNTEEHGRQHRQLFNVGPGSFVGLLPLQTGEPWLMTVRAVGEPLDNENNDEEKETTTTTSSSTTSSSTTTSSTTTSSTTTVVIRVTRDCYASIVQRSPRSLFHATALLCSTLSPLLRMIDYGLTWRRMEPGEILVKEGDSCDRLCVVLHGRLREMKTQ